MEPLVSIITATSNIIKEKRQKVFLQAVESVRRQSYKNIEHIIIDNNSKDGSIELFEKENLTYFSEPDTGIFNAFNKGVKRAKGKYIIFLNSDDYYHYPKGIEEAVKCLEETDADYCYSECNIVYDKNQITQLTPQVYKTFRVMPFCHQTVMCKRSLLEELPFDESYNIIADYKWIMLLTLQKRKKVELDCNFVTFRVAGKSVIEVEENAEENKRLYKEVLSDIYPLTDAEIDYAMKTSCFPKELENILCDYFPDREEYFANGLESYAERTGQVPINALTEDINKRKTEDNTETIDNLLTIYKNILPDINKLLYLKLNENDRKIFIDFFLKRFGGIETISEYDKKLLDEIFEETYKLYQERTAITDILPIILFDRSAQIVSPTPIHKERPSREDELLQYYEYAHSFILNEYIMPEFEPQDGQTIIDCGAAIGDTAILFKLRYPDSPVYSIEATEECYKYLEKNIKINHYQDVTPIRTIITNKKTKETMSIDELVKKYDIKNIGLIKFDIEGSERLGLEGAVETIISQKPVLMVPIYHLGDDCYQIPRILSKLNMPMEFRLRWIEKRVWGMDCTLFVKFK